MEEFIFNLNKQASTLIALKNYKGAFSLLSKSLKILKSSNDSIAKFKLLSLTYGNLSNLYKDLGKLADAIKCLQTLIEIEKKIPGSKFTTINAYLNLCSFYSSLQQHEIALRYGLTSIILLQKDMILPKKYTSTLVIAFHNVGVEYEHLHKYEEAVDSYRKGWDLAKSQLGLLHPLTLSIKESFVESKFHKPRLPELTPYKISNFAKKKETLTLYSMNTNSTATYIAKTTRADFEAKAKGTKKRFSVPDNEYEVKRYKIDLMTQRNNESYAASCIQAWWRGVLARKKVKIIKMKEELKKAALKAKIAFDDYKILKKAVMNETEILPKIKDNGGHGNIIVLKSMDEKLPNIGNFDRDAYSRIQTSHDPYKRHFLIDSDNF